MSPQGIPKTPAPSGNASGRLALRRQFARLKEVEALPEYSEMRDAADASHAAEAALPHTENGKRAAWL